METMKQSIANRKSQINLLLLTLPFVACAAPSPLVIRGGGGEVRVDPQYGDILSTSVGGYRSGDRGLWSVTFKSGTRLDASEFRSHPDWFRRREGNRFTWREGYAEVTVEFVGGPDGIDVKGSVTSRQEDNPALTFELPARLWFDPKPLERFYLPQRGNGGLGMALKRSFFEETSGLKYPAWKQVGPHPWKRNPVAERDALMEKLLPAAAKASSRKKVGFVFCPCGPEWGSISTSIIGCRRKIDALLKGQDCETVDLTTLDDLKAALADDSFRFVFNPYGDLVPMTCAADIQPTIAAIKAYESRGGKWVSTAAIDEITAFVRGGYYSYSFSYPNMFFDFCQFSGAEGNVALYGVRPRPPHAPWKNPREHHFVASVLGVGGAARGGYVDHRFEIYGKCGEPFAVPAMRFSFAASLDEALQGYAWANDIVKPMSAKAPAKLIEAVRQAPIVTMYGRKADRCAELAEMLPVPAIVHLTSYLKGGFDKEYPDHLPTSAQFGGDAAHRALIDRVHARGHLYMPYTNPTWWCDHPRGPTFQAAGEEPLQVNLDGSHTHEVYKNDGWTTCFWHPAVIAANRKTVTQFLTEMPSDIVFQDQCGARRFKYDINPAAPSPAAYNEGLLSQLEEDASRVPLGTEDGWDKVANEELLVCGCSWVTIPRHVDWRGGRDDYRTLQKEILSPETWEIEPLVMRLMHEKCFFYCHDLSGSAFCERLVAWDLALGYNLSYDVSSRPYKDCTSLQPWEAYVAALQKHVVSRIAGQPLGKFRHDRAPLFARTDTTALTRLDDGVVIASWGDVRCVVNLGDVPREVTKGLRLAPYGYLVVGPNVKAEYLDGGRPTISVDGKVVITFDQPK